MTKEELDKSFAKEKSNRHVDLVEFNNSIEKNKDWRNVQESFDNSINA
jgi:hypothetical protein